MFTPFERNSVVGPENASSRGSAPGRISAGMSSLGDENQIRIQLAVHKYNSSGSSPIAGRRSLVSPAKHSFLKNSIKRKFTEEDAETTAKNDKKRGNQYEGVGAFPTVHLKKNAVLYRPIRRHNEVKVPYPELPVNRFLNHLPELCSDSKSSTRSVLDVLQNLSGKNIHSKEENDCSRNKSKGLGGDLVLDGNSVYKPLFVQRPNLKAILTRDSTTQTLLSPSSDTGSPKLNESNNKNSSSGTPDPKAEIRRKLARKNNEIFASLSSSVAFPGNKRKLDKVGPLKDDTPQNDSTGAKKQKLFENHNSVHEGSPSMVNGSKSILNDHSAKLSRKNKLNDSTSTSPNKDRLTTIYLDMKSTSPKNVAFQSMSTTSNDIEKTPETKSPEESTPKSNTLGTPDTNKPTFQFNAGTTFNFKPNELSKSPSINFSATTVPAPTVSEPQKPSSPVQINGSGSFLLSKPAESSPVVTSVESNTKTTTAPTFSFGIPPQTTTSLSSDNKLTSGNPDINKTLSTTTSEEKTAQGGSSPISNKPDETPKASFGTGFKFGNTETFKGFQFSSGTTNLKSQSSDNTSKVTTSEVSTAVATSTTTTVPQFTFGVNNAKASLPSSTSVYSESKNTTATTFKPMFTFGQTPLNSSTENKSSESGDKPATNTSTTVNAQIAPTTSLFGDKTLQPTGGFTFGKATTVSPGKENSDAQKNPPPSLGQGFTLPQPATTSHSLNFSTTVTTQGGGNVGSTFLQSTTNSSLTTVSTATFTFGQKSPTSTTSNLPSSTSESKTEKPAFNFSFQAKPLEANQNKPSEANPLEQKAPSSMFTFGQKTTQSSTPTTTTSTQSLPTSVTQPTSLFSGGASTNQEKEKTQVSIFGQNQTSRQESTNAFGMKSDSTTFGQDTSTGAFSFTAKTPAFGATSTAAQPTPAFGATSTAAQPTSAFGATSTTAQPTPAFGATSTTAQPTSAFGATSTAAQSTPVFGSSVSTSQTNVFGAPASVSSSVTFGTPAASQSTSAFGTPSVGFGASNTPGSQGGSLTTQSATPFGSGFGAPVSQSSTGFGTTSGFGTSQASFQQPFGQNKPSVPTSSIFGQPSATTVSSTGFAASSSTSFNSSPSQNSLFGQKTTTPANIFGQNPKPTPLFGQNTTAPAFGTQSKFSFGMTTSNNTNFTTSPPSSTTAPAFNFGSGASSSSTFNFGSSSSSGTTSTDSPFAFKGATNEAFKFGASTTKEGPGFGASSTFTFGASQPNATSEVKPPGTNFNFGSAPTSSAAPGFGFSATPSPSVFSFGGSGSSVSSGSSFNFGTPQPGGPFGQTSTPSPGLFSVPGTFSIGSGSSQSRPRASSRLRRRP